MSEYVSRRDRIYKFAKVGAVLALIAVILYLLGHLTVLFSMQEYSHADRLGKEIVWNRMSVSDAEYLLRERGYNVEGSGVAGSDTDLVEERSMSFSKDMKTPMLLTHRRLRINIRFEGDRAVEHFTETLQFTF